MAEADEKPKKLGELLVESGLVAADKLPEGLEYAKRHSLPLGRVLITLKLLREVDLESALHSQALMKMDRLPARLAVRAITLAHTNNLSIDRALKKLGWFPDKYIEGEAMPVAIAREHLTNSESTFGKEHPESAAARIRLAEALTDNRKYAEAEALYQTASKIVEECFGHQSLEMANLLGQMAGHYFVQDKFDEAERLYWQSYELKHNLLGDKDLRVAECLEDLAELYDVQSEYLQAERLYLSSIGIKEKVLAADDPEMIQSLRKLVLICRQSEHGPESRQTGDLLMDAGMVNQKKIEEGLELAKKYNIPLGRALISIKQLSQEDLQRVMHAQLLMKDGGVPGYIVVRALKASCNLHISVGDALKKIGWRREHPADQRQLELLLRCSDELIKLEQELTPEHEQVASKCIELADLYAGANNLREAEMLLGRALKIYEKLEGNEGTLQTLSALARVHALQGRWAESQGLIDRAIALAKKGSSKPTAKLAELLESQVRILHASGESKEALQKVAELIELRKKVDGNESANVSGLMELQADIEISQGNMAEAEKLYARSLAIKEKVLVGGNPQITGLLCKLGELQLKKNDFKTALEHFQKALEMNRNLWGQSHPVLAFSELSLARCYEAMKETQKAKECYSRAIAIMEASAGADHEDTARVLEQYAEFLKNQGQMEESEAIVKRIDEIREQSESRHTAMQLRTIH